MNTYGFSVTDAEFKAAPPPSLVELATTAQALGIALKVNVPHLECFTAVSEITPSPRLRRLLRDAYDQVLKNQGLVNKGLVSVIFSYSTTIGERFIAALCGDIGSTFRRSMNTQLLQYASEMVDISPKNNVAQQIGRSKTVQEFTVVVAANLAKDLPVLRICYEGQADATEALKTLLGTIAHQIESGLPLSDALHAMYPQTFDRLYVSMVRSAERLDELHNEIDHMLAEAFDLLAKS